MENKGKVYIASMNMRGIRAQMPENTVAINITSAQALNNANRRDFSPMTVIEGRYKGFYCFENYWQSHKKFTGIDFETTYERWRGLNEPKRRMPATKGKTVEYALFEGRQLGYIESRKQIYMPEYYELIRGRRRQNIGSTM